MDAILDELQANLKEWQVVFDSQFDPASSRDILRAHSKRYLKLLSDLNESVSGNDDNDDNDVDEVWECASMIE